MKIQWKMVIERVYFRQHPSGDTLSAVLQTSGADNLASVAQPVMMEIVVRDPKDFPRFYAGAPVTVTLS